MNERGHPETLVASHPGNTNAVRSGVHSPRLIQARAAEIKAELERSFTFSATQAVAVHEVARCTALLEAIDRELDERGLVDKQGKPRYLLPHRARISRQLESGFPRSRWQSSRPLQSRSFQPPGAPSTCGSSSASPSVTTPMRVPATG